jgi:hypothetical protein
MGLETNYAWRAHFTQCRGRAEFITGLDLSLNNLDLYDVSGGLLTAVLKRMVTPP